MSDSPYLLIVVLLAGAVAFALTPLELHAGAGLPGAIGSAIGRIVIENNNFRLRQGFPEFTDNLAHRRLFIETRNQDCNLHGSDILYFFAV